MKKFTLNTLLLLVLSTPAFAQTKPIAMPRCDSKNGKLLSLNNEGVMNLKNTTKNLYSQQVFVKGTLISIEPTVRNRYGEHAHFIVALKEGATAEDRPALIEISHSMNGFNAPTPQDLAAGPIFICGEYSTTDVNKLPKITKFTPSRTGAMIHWTHQANRDPDTRSLNHPHGWIYANGKIFGRTRY